MKSQTGQKIIAIYMFTNLCYIYTYIYCPTARSKGNRIKKITSGSKILREKYFC